MFGDTVVWYGADGCEVQSVCEVRCCGTVVLVMVLGVMSGVCEEDDRSNETKYWF